MSKDNNFPCPTDACYFEVSDRHEIDQIYHVGEVTKGDYVGWHIFCWRTELKYVKNITKLDADRVNGDDPANGWRICPAHAPMVMYNVIYRIK